MNAESNDKPYNKPGPQTGHTVEIVKLGIVVGRNKIAVPPDEVEHQASLGCTDREIANYFGVKEDTLRRHFADFLAKGRYNLKTSLRQAQLRVALDGNPTMLIWLGKNILQQNDAGSASDEVRALPWTDEMDDVVEDEEDLNETTNEDTE
ncbi:hypothetical protein [Brevundimonas sp.]|jgi:hypothetical protein|uniref:hypothetical protein n=1 Tax=Brevundimonas sp. TaxID=1871086 RepID=UPI003783A237